MEKAHDERMPFTCDICNKSFSNRGNYNRHVARHTDDNQYQCSECGTVFARRDNYYRHYNKKHGGKETADDEPAPKRQKMSEDVRDNYSITMVKEVHMKKFKTKGHEYTVKFNEDLGIHDPPAVLEALLKVFQSLVDTITKDAHPQDLIRMVVTSPELDYPIALPFIAKNKLTAALFLLRIETVLQSYQEFTIDGTLEIHVTHVAMPVGGKHAKKRYVDLKRYLRENKCIIQIMNKDELCCARAIVTAKARLEKHKKWETIRKGGRIQRKLAEDLHRQAQVPMAACGIDQIKRFQQVLSNWQIMVASKDHANAIIYRGPPAGEQIYLYHHNGHYDVITSMQSFLNRSYFCIACMKGYNTKTEHRCEHTCKLCFQANCTEGEWKYCRDCNRKFKSNSCYQNHLKQTTPSSKSVCKLYYKCRDCDQFVSTKRHKGRQHICGEKYCNVCKDFVPQDHQCYMQPVVNTPNTDTATDEFDEPNDDPPSQNKVIKNVTTYIFFDFESIQENGIHEPNLCVAHKVCTQCLDKENATSCNWCGERERMFQGPTTRQDFCKWLFSEANAGAVCLCHNFKGYDSYFVLRYLYDNAKLPEVIFNGAKVMSITVAATDMKFIDSLNFLPMGLSKLPGAFGLKELAKGYFPHLFNTKANQNAILSQLPHKQYYNPDGMSVPERKKFDEWYDAHQNDLFDFKQEIIKYCKSDVDILRRCCLQFRSLFIEMTTDDTTPGIDPFQQCITIASACNLVFRTKYLRPNTIGIIHPLGNLSNDRQSVKAMQWLKWYANKNGLYIKHAANGGEVNIGKYKADGYYEANGERIVLEFHGCLHHGHNCLHRDTKHPLNGMTMQELFQKTLDKRQYIESRGYNYIEKWECEFDSEMQGDSEMAKFVSALEIPTPLVPREAFFGGRTNATKLYYSVEPDEKIKYVDFTSLYSCINKYGRYPIGHPTIITENFGDVGDYEGLIKCKVLPPRGLYHPVLPYKAMQRLMFPLCSKCCEAQSLTPCKHSDDDRALVGTWVTMELQKALEKGYAVLRIYEVWHFDEVAVYDPETKEGGLFASYVNAFLKLKQEASDWPSWCHTDKQKREYIQQYLNKEGIKLDCNNIKRNPGLRALAKLMLNSFWGKFGQRLNMGKTTHLTDPAEYFDLMNRDDTEIHNVNFVSAEMVAVQWKHTEDFVEPSGRTNIIVAAYTTAQARLKLYQLLEKLDRRVLYFDTDSVIYVSREGQWEPEIGDFLGELTDEIDSGNHIVTFVSGGPKNYAYKLAKPDENGDQTHCKVRGITLNCRNDSVINFDTVARMVRGQGEQKVQVVDPYKITRNKKTMNIETSEEKKHYQVVYTKRVIQDGYDTLPYGY